MSELTKKLRCLIIDDDPTITDLIQYFCSKVDRIEFCLTCNNAIDGLKLISSQEFDLLFLDYNMPDLNGKAILDLKKDNSKVIMITSHADFAVESYNYDKLIDYLLKPIKFERFLKAIEKFEPAETSAVESNDNEQFFVKDGNKWVNVKLNDVLYIKSDSNYVTWHTASRQVISLMNLKDLESELPNRFIRVHRSYIINTEKIESISKDSVVINNVSISIGNSYKHLVEKIISS